MLRRMQIRKLETMAEAIRLLKKEGQCYREICNFKGIMKSFHEISVEDKWDMDYEKFEEFLMNEVIYMVPTEGVDF